MSMSELDDIATGVGDGEYEAPSQFVRPPDAGEYTFMRVVEDEERDFKFGRFTTKGDNPQSAAWYNIKAVIQGGPFDGRYVSGGFNTLVSSYRNGTTADDFVRSAKASARPKTFKEWDLAIPTIFGPFKAVIDWEWTCMDCTDDNDKPIVFLKGMRGPKKPKKYDGVRVKVTKNPDGTTPHVVECPECHKEIGARAQIKTYVVSSATSRPAQSPTVTIPSADLPPAEG